MLVEALGWTAAAASLTASSMRTMLPLRCVNLFANVMFIIYSFYLDIAPTLVLHSCLLLVNLFRLVQILQQKRSLRLALDAAHPLDALKPLMKVSTFTEGEKIFTRGDEANRVYYIDAGTVILPEIGVTLEAGELFGEMAYFSAARTRSTSAVCHEDSRILTIDEAAFTRLYHQSPEFGMYVLHLIAQRLIEGCQKRPELYQEFVKR